MSNRFNPILVLAVAAPFAVIGIILSGISAVQAADSDRVFVTVRALSHTDLTDSDIEYVKKGVSTIPPAIQKRIASAGIEVVLTPQMSYDEPENSGKKLFRNGGTSDNVGGLFEAGKNRVAIPERASWRNSPPKPQGKGIVGICRHELGHAFDHALGGHSHSESYLVAYNEDFKRFTNEQCRRWAYYITGISSGDANVPTSSGRAECFASVFAALVTPSNELTKQSADLLQAFPNVAKNLQNLDGELGHVPESSSSPVASRNAFGNASGNASCNASGNASGNAFGNAFRRNAFRRNASPDQSESDSHVQLAKDFLIRKEFARAADQLTFAIKLNPNNAQAFLLRGNASFWMTKHKLAIQDYSAAIRLEPANKDAYLLRSRAYGWLGERLLQEHDEAKARQLN